MDRWTDRDRIILFFYLIQFIHCLYVSLLAKKRQRSPLVSIEMRKLFLKNFAFFAKKNIFAENFAFFRI